MPYPRPEAYSSSSDQIVYPVEQMREAAAQILAKAGYAQSQHDLAWQQIQNYVSQHVDPPMQSTILDCLKPYADRLRTTYTWQIDFASALFTAVDAITSVDEQAAQSFTPQGPGH